MKKYLLISFFLLLAVFFFFEDVSRLFFDLHLKSLFGSGAKFQSFKIEDGRFVLRGVSASLEGADLFFEEISCRLRPKPLEFFIKSDLKIKNPKVVLKRFSGNLVDRMGKKSGFFKTRMELSGGEISFLGRSEVVDFSAKKERGGDIDLLFKLREESGVVCRIKRESESIDLTAKVSSSVEKLRGIINFFYGERFDEVRGVLDAELSLSLKKSYPPKLDISATFSDLYLSQKKGGILSAEGLSLHVESYREGSDYLMGRLCRNFIVEGEVKRGRVAVDSNSAILEDISGNFYYHPTFLPRCDFKMFANIHGKRRPFEVRTEKLNKDWVDLKFSFSNKRSNILLKREKERSIIQAKIDGVGCELWEIFKEGVKGIFIRDSILRDENLEIKDGILKADLEVEFSKDGVDKIELSNMVLKDLLLKSESFEISAPSIEGGFSIEPSSNFLGTINSNLKFFKGSALIGKKRIEGVEGSICVEGGVFKRSRLFCVVDGLMGSADIGGEISALEVDLKLLGEIEKFPFGMEGELLSAFLKVKGDGLNFNIFGTGHIEDGKGRYEGFSIQLKTGLFNLKSFWIRADDFSLDRVSSFLPYRFLGVGSFYIFSKDGKVRGSFRVDEGRYETDSIVIRVDRGKESSFSYSGGRADAKIVGLDGEFYLKGFDRSFVCMGADIDIKGKTISFSLPNVKSFDIDMGGELYLDLGEDLKLDIVADKASGRVDDLDRFLKGFYDLGLGDISGEFLLSDFYFSKVLSKEEKFFIGARGAFKNSSFSKGFIRMENVDIDFDVGNRDGKAESSFSGDLIFNGEKYHIECPLFGIDDGLGIFDIRGERDGYEFIRVSAKMEDYRFVFDEKTHFFGEKVLIESFEIDRDFKVLDAKVSSDISLDRVGMLFGRDFSGDLSFEGVWKDGDGMFTLSGSEVKVFQDISTLFLKVSRKDGSFRVKKFRMDNILASCDIFFDEEFIRLGGLKAVDRGSWFEGEVIYSKKKRRADLNIKEMKVSLGEGEFFEKIFSFLKGGEVFGSGWVNYDFMDNMFEMDLDLTSLRFLYKDIWVENQKALNLHYSKKEGVRFQGADLAFSSEFSDLSGIRLSGKYANFDIDEGRFFIKEGDLYLPRDILGIVEKGFLKDPLKKSLFLFLSDSIVFEKDIHLFLDISFKDSELTATCKEGAIFSKKAQRCFKNLSCSFSEGRGFIGFDYIHDGNPHRIEVVSNIGKENFGTISLGEKNRLEAKWRCQGCDIIIDSIFGSYGGVSSDMLLEREEGDSYSLIGNIDIDFGKAKDLLPIAFKRRLSSFGKGYKLKGRVNFSKGFSKFLGFSGDIVCRDFEVSDYVLKSGFGNIKFSKDRCEIENFKVIDKALSLDVKDIIFERGEDGWGFSVPILELFEFRPSILKKGGVVGEIKPLVLREFKIFDLSGILGKGMMGKGYFNFVNSFKRGHSLFEIPADFLGRLFGLDLELLVPVAGKVFFDIGDGRINVERIEDMYSENGRSKFFLLDGSYMDLNGDLNVDIKMKQYVLFKITEKFILSVRGNIKEPKVTLRKKRGE